MKQLCALVRWLAWLLGATLGMTACASLPQDIPRDASYTLAGTDGTRLGQMTSKQAAAHPGLSGAYPLTRGQDAFLARLALAQAAERSLDVQYYIWRNDSTGRVLLNHLVRAAERGVRVRLLIDDLGTAPNDAHLLLIDGNPNIEVRLFNPIASRSARLFGTVTDFGRVNRRMHNKSFTADGQATIVGGRNVGDEYFEAASDLDFADMDVIAVGPVVKQVSTAFDLYWNNPAAIPIAALAATRVSPEDVERARAALDEYGESQRGGDYAQALRNSDLARAFREGVMNFFWGRAEALYDDPAKITQSPQDQGTHLLPQLGKVTDSTHGELLIISPYFIPGDAGVEYFRRMRARGVHVLVLTNSLAATDVSAVHAGYSRYRQPLLESGVELYEVKATARRPGEAKTRSGSGPGGGGSSRASLHAKVFVFDRRALFVGSLNLDPRSASLNTEMGLLFETPDLASQAAKDLLAAVSGATYRLVLVPAGATGSSAKIEWIGHENGQEVRLDSEPQAGFWRRVGVWFMSWLPIESQL